MPTPNKRAVPPCACTAVKQLSRVLGRTYDAALADAGINITQLAVMRSIARHDGEPLVRVAEELEMDRTSLYRAIDPMLRNGWVVLAQGANARSRAAKLTAKGIRLLAKAGVGADNIQGRLVEHFGRAAFSSLIAELHRLSESAETVAAG